MNSQWNLNMGLQHSNTGGQKSNKACSRTLDGVFEIGMAPSSNTEEVFEPRSSTKEGDQEAKDNTEETEDNDEVETEEVKPEENSEEKSEENKVMKKQNSICKLKNFRPAQTKSQPVRTS